MRNLKSFPATPKPKQLKGDPPFLQRNPVFSPTLAQTLILVNAHSKLECQHKLGTGLVQLNRLIIIAESFRHYNSHGLV